MALRKSAGTTSINLQWPFAKLLPLANFLLQDFVRGRPSVELLPLASKDNCVLHLKTISDTV